jgi:hypothetical protein
MFVATAAKHRQLRRRTPRTVIPNQDNVEKAMEFLTYQPAEESSAGLLPRANDREGAAPISAPIVAETHIPARTTPWDAALQKIAAYEAGLERQQCPLHLIRVHGSKLVAAGRVLQLDDDGFERLCRALAAPAKYVARFGPMVRSGLLNYDLMHSDGTSRLAGNAVVLSRDNTFRGFDRGDLYRLPATEVLCAVHAGIQEHHEELGIQTLKLNDEALQMDIVSPLLTEAIRVGDVIRYGLRVRHSLLGEYATTIESFAFRLVCSNGLVQRQCPGGKGTARSRPRTRRLPARFGDAKQQQRQQIARLAAEAWQRLRGMSEGIRGLQARRLDLGDLQRFLRQARMHSGRLLKLVEAAWGAEGAEPTAYGFLNALTWVATHEPGLSDQQRRRLDLLAGVFAGQDTHLCPHCFSLITA